jgi:hypothetical protein
MHRADCQIAGSIALTQKRLKLLETDPKPQQAAGDVFR